MKPMLAVVVLGVSFTLFMLYLGKTKHDGVVVQKPYEAGVAFETTQQDIQSVQHVVDNFKAIQKDGKVMVTMDILPENSNYKTIVAESIIFEPPMGVPVMLTKNDNNSFSGSTIPAGWYSVKLYLKTDNKTVVTKKSIYLEKE